MKNLILACTRQIGVNIIGLPWFHKLYKSVPPQRGITVVHKSKYHS